MDLVFSNYIICIAFTDYYNQVLLFSAVQLFSYYKSSISPGPINWFLSLQMWKLPARLSYAVYLIHVSIIYVANGSWVKTYYFNDGNNVSISCIFILNFHKYIFMLQKVMHFNIS